MIDYDFTKQAEKTFLKLPKNIQKRIIEKVEFYLKQPRPLVFAKRLTDTKPSFRFQIGDYRVIFDWEHTTILITAIGHRKEIYHSF